MDPLKRRNKKTGEISYSYDGGESWGKHQQPDAVGPADSNTAGDTVADAATGGLAGVTADNDADIAGLVAAVGHHMGFTDMSREQGRDAYLGFKEHAQNRSPSAYGVSRAAGAVGAALELPAGAASIGMQGAAQGFGGSAGKDTPTRLASAVGGAGAALSTMGLAKGAGSMAVQAAPELAAGASRAAVAATGQRDQDLVRPVGEQAAIQERLGIGGPFAGKTKILRQATAAEKRVRGERGALEGQFADEGLTVHGGAIGQRLRAAADSKAGGVEGPQARRQALLDQADELDRQHAEQQAALAQTTPAVSNGPAPISDVRQGGVTMPSPPPAMGSGTEPMIRPQGTMLPPPGEGTEVPPMPPQRALSPESAAEDVQTTLKKQGEKKAALDAEAADKEAANKGREGLEQNPSMPARPGARGGRGAGRVQAPITPPKNLTVTQPKPVRQTEPVHTPQFDTLPEDNTPTHRPEPPGTDPYVRPQDTAQDLHEEAVSTNPAHEAPTSLHAQQAAILRARAAKMGFSDANTQTVPLRKAAGEYEAQGPMPFAEVNAKRKFWGDKANFTSESDQNLVRKDMHGALNDSLEAAAGTRGERWLALGVDENVAISARDAADAILNKRAGAPPIGANGVIGSAINKLTGDRAASMSAAGHKVASSAAGIAGRVLQAPPGASAMSRLATQGAQAVVQAGTPEKQAQEHYLQTWINPHYRKAALGPK